MTTVSPIRRSGVRERVLAGLALCASLLGCAVGPGNVQVRLAPYAAPPAAAASRGVVRVDSVREARRDAVGRLVGQRTGLGGMSMGQIEVNPTPVAVTTAVLQAELRGMGFTASDAAPVRLSGRLTRFEVQTPATALYWDINCAIDLEVEAKLSDRRQHTAAYEARCTVRTYSWPGEELIAQSLDGCLKELGARIRADAALAGFLSAP